MNLRWSNGTFTDDVSTYSPHRRPALRPPRSDPSPAPAPLPAFRVGPSAIPNGERGAIAVRRIKAGEKIADYTASTSFVETQAQFLRRHPDRHAINTAEIGNLYYTATNPAANPVGMINRASRGKRNNARFAKSSAVKARDPTPAGREMLLAYFPAFYGSYPELSRALTQPNDLG